MNASQDIVIVGGGPAGCTTAIALERMNPSLRGRIVVLERAEYPREKPCAGAIGGRGDRILASLDAVPNVPSVMVEGVSFRGQDTERAASIGASIGRVVRRIEFDHALARIAMSRGIRFMTGTRVDSITVDRGGARVETSKGSLSARVVIGCDGVGSVVRKSLGNSVGGLRAQVLELDTESVPGDRDRRLLHFDAGDMRYTGYYWDFPTIVDGVEKVCRGIYHLKVDETPTDIQALLAERLARWGLDITTYKNKRFAERGYELAGTVARGPLMLAGESVGVDPVTGEGIAQAIEYGEMAARFLEPRLRHENTAVDLGAWQGVLRRSRLSMDLLFRNVVVKAFYGPARRTTENIIINHFETLYVGCQHFGGVPVHPTRAVKAVMQIGQAAVHESGAIVRMLGAMTKRKLTGTDRPQLAV